MSVAVRRFVMSSRTVILAVMAAALANAVLALRTDTLGPIPSDLTSLSETPTAVTQTTDGMLVAQAPIHTVALARVAPDGSIVIVCVESNEAAQRFLHEEQMAEPHKAKEK